MINTYLESVLNELMQEKKILIRQELKSIFWLREPRFIVKARDIEIKTVNELINITKIEMTKIKKETYTDLKQTLNQFEGDTKGLLEFTTLENKKQLQGYLSSLTEVTYRNGFNDETLIRKIRDRTVYEFLLTEGKIDFTRKIDKLEFKAKRLESKLQKEFINNNSMLMNDEKLELLIKKINQKLEENSQRNEHSLEIEYLLDIDELNKIRSFIEKELVKRKIPKNKNRRTHTLKTEPSYFEAVLNGSKKFEIRKNDRNYQVGDFLLLQEWDPKESMYTGRSVLVKIIYMSDFKQNEGYVVLSIEVQ
ncbi:ASCH/PUA domain-containing protein [Carnobacterium divergens]|uniref:DUF3850 domain-containing protein n=1 Tax=Carnobacterium divergens TaxID=2748 RepID=A0AAW8RB69_CARDV|nr:ASCH/PUA domain-containing protein [Carnobacterium divergens]MDT1958956.1 DUF3850 domain-containing protein [Carnobacterium divergens]MDT1974924.1 DUF3850 domain-containing protein [Carnobacterium divergens]MDT2012888.1 DUF3850 domain-containing protein [Carnobacterium divergens]